MIPVLVVGGRKLKVVSLNYRDNKVVEAMTMDENKHFVTYYDESQGMYVEDALRVNMKDCLIWEGRHDDVIQVIEKAIDEMDELLTEIAHEYIQENIPFGEISETRKQYFQLQHQIDGLHEALSLIRGKHDENTLDEFTTGVIQVIRKGW